MMKEEKLAWLERTWLLELPIHIQEMAQGYNNGVQLVKTGDSKQFVLKTYRNVDTRRLDTEHALTLALAQIPLPFSVPAPCKTQNETTLEVFETENYSLWPFVKGEPARSGLAQAASVGEAVALLSQALAKVDVGDVALPPTYGDFSAIHPAVADPLDALVNLPRTKAEKAYLHTVISDVLERTPRYYAQLPRQLIHGDFIRGNLLVQDDKVKAVLDFEFATFDLRALDLATALFSWSAGFRNDEMGWRIIDKLGQRYVSKRNLSIDECEALPDLIRLRLVVWLTYFIGRYMQAESTRDAIITDALFIEKSFRWIDANAQRLVTTAKQW